MGTKWVIQLPTLNVNLMLYVPQYLLQELFGVLLLFRGPDCASLGFICRLAFTGILIGEILAPALSSHTRGYPPSQMAAEIGTT